MILVTGGHGFIGQAVCRRITELGDTPKVVDLPDGDIRDPHSTRAAVEGCDGVINLAGTLGTSETIGADRDMIDSNIVGALNVADACAAEDIPFVQIGTGHKGTLNVYAVTKACAEDLLLTRARWLGHKVNVVRAFHAYGPGQKAPAPWGTGTVTKIIPNFVCRALTDTDIPIHGSGLQLVDLVYVDDVARLLVAALDGGFGHVLEAGTGYGRTVADVALDVVAACESNSKLVSVTPPKGFACEDAVANSGSEATPWPTGLAQTVAYYRGQLCKS